MKLVSMAMLSSRPVRVSAGVIAGTLLLFSAVNLKADTFYPTNNNVSLLQTGLTVTPEGPDYFWDIQIEATNDGSQTLSNVYLFSWDVQLNGTEATLTSPGDYTVATDGLFADSTNAAVYITQSQTDTIVDADSQGSPTVPEMPGFLIADLLAPGQSVSFDVDFLSDPTTGTTSLYSNAFTTADVVSTTPEPGSLILLGSGLLGFAGIARRRMLSRG